jgi:hypothetical protein
MAPTVPAAAETPGATVPDPLAFDDLFPPAEAAEPAGTPGTAAPVSVPAELPAAQAAPDFARASSSRAPLLAGLAVTLAVLVFGGGFLWWRNRDSRYWPA